MAYRRREVSPYGGLRNIDTFVDRHGTRRYYYRVGKGPRVRLPAPGSVAFVLAYEDAAALIERLGSGL